MNKKAGFLAFILIAAMVVACGCSSSHPKGNESVGKDPAAAVRIGVFEPLSGSDEKQGAFELQGIELAHDLHPKVLGKPVELVYGDNRSTVSGAEKAAERLVDSQVAVVLGSYGNTLSLAGSDTFKKAKLPAIGVTCTNPLITKSSDYYTRVCFADSFQEKGGSSAEDTAFDSRFDSDQTLTDTSTVFLKAYHQKYGADQEPSKAAALGFDAYLMAIDAITRAQTAADTTAVRDAILKTKELQGATGSITIDKNGDPIKADDAKD